RLNRDLQDFRARVHALDHGYGVGSINHYERMQRNQRKIENQIDESRRRSMNPTFFNHNN
ncbi:MAG: hypothetical protein Q4G69_14865, partial [Planctomycetia bacterium]|nr:hypothetical protein [Planctomycetia bacterium]